MTNQNSLDLNSNDSDRREKGRINLNAAKVEHKIYTYN